MMWPAQPLQRWPCKRIHGYRGIVTARLVSAFERLTNLNPSISHCFSSNIAICRATVCTMKKTSNCAFKFHFMCLIESLSYFLRSFPIVRSLVFDFHLKRHLWFADCISFPDLVSIIPGPVFSSKFVSSLPYTQSSHTFALFSLGYLASSPLPCKLISRSTVLHIDSKRKSLSGRA